MTKKRIVFIGAGPACLTCAYILREAKGFDFTILEAHPDLVGGISRTDRYKEYLFDIGGHRFFSKSEEINKIWKEILGDELVERNRLSKIFYRGNFFSYPLKPLGALYKLGFLEAFLCSCSYLKAKLFPVRDPRSFEDWVSNKFGKRLYRIFFQTYTEKVWGIPCKEISADWAAQRIKNMSLLQAVFQPVVAGLRSLMGLQPNTKVKTLVSKFLYPRKGPGMMWKVALDKLQETGRVKFCPDRRVVGISKLDDGFHLNTRSSAGAEEEFFADTIVNSASLKDLVSFLPDVPEEVQEAANSLRYRDFLIIVLIINESHLFDEQWIYIHDPNVQVGRIQNFGNWSPEMVPGKDQSSLGLEYFCIEDDPLWKKSDNELVALAKKELHAVQLIGEGHSVLDACVVRQRKAYPVYDHFYEKHVEVIREYLEGEYPQLHTIGRNGMHKYNNQDHAMMTGILVAKNIIEGTKVFDHWSVNVDAEYHELSDLRKAAVDHPTPKMIKGDS